MDQKLNKSAETIHSYSQNIIESPNTIPDELNQNIISKENQYLIQLFNKKISKIQNQDLLIENNQEEKMRFSYKGQYKIIKNQKIKHGLGKLIINQTYFYLGQWKDNQKHGMGIQINQQGNRYQGSFQYGCREGFGIQKLINGIKYTGQWKNNVKQGQGTQYDSISKQTYKGSYKNGKKNGHGSYLYRSGDLFKGNWINNLKNGPGLLIFYNGTIFKSFWQNNIINGYSSLYYKNGDHFKGQYKNRIRKGFGIYYYASGQKIEGQWINDNYCLGKIYYLNGNVYEGTINQGQLVNPKFYSLSLKSDNLNQSRKQINTKFSTPNKIQKTIRKEYKQKQFNNCTTPRNIFNEF